MLYGMTLPILLALTLGQTGSATPAGTLTIGDVAPPMKVAKWVKGQPVTGFAKGKVYVVEFWATWCPPCRESIPHLTALQKKYKGRVSFNGVAIWQREAKTAYVGKVQSFVKTMGAKMNYNVAVDTDPRLGEMANRWMVAAGQNGVPTAFVVGKDGRIAWIGHPMDAELPRTLDAILANKYDALAAREAARRKAAAAEAMQTAMTAVTAAYKAGDEARAETLLTDLVAAFPETAGMVLNVRFERALDLNEDARAHEVLRNGWGGANLGTQDLNEFAWTLATDPRIEARDYALAIALATKGVELSNEADAAVIDTLAYALFHSGKVDEAIAWQTKAVALTKGQDAEIVAALEKYKKAKSGS